MSKILKLDPSIDDKDLGRVLYGYRQIRDWRWLWLRKRDVYCVVSVEDVPYSIAFAHSARAEPVNPPLQGSYCLIHGWWRDQPHCPGCDA